MAIIFSRSHAGLGQKAHHVCSPEAKVEGDEIYSRIKRSKRTLQLPAHADLRLSSLGLPLRGTLAAEACRAGRLCDMIGVRARITALTDSLSWAERMKWAQARRVPASRYMICRREWDA